MNEHKIRDQRCSLSIYDDACDIELDKMIKEIIAPFEVKGFVKKKAILDGMQQVYISSYEMDENNE